MGHNPLKKTLQSLIFFSIEQPLRLLKFSLDDFNDNNGELSHLQIPTHDWLEQSVTE